MGLDIFRRTKFARNRLPIKRGDKDEELTGYVQGKDASDLEERVARFLYQNRYEFTYEYYLTTAVGLPGEDRVIDFIVDVGGPRLAWEIDGEIGHNTIDEKEADQRRDTFVNEILLKMGINPIERIPWHLLQSQEQTNETLRLKI